MHAYSIMEAKEIKGQRLLKVRYVAEKAKPLGRLLTY